MSTKNLIVFVGASAALSTELKSLERRLSHTRTVVPTMDKNSVGVTARSIERAADELQKHLPAPSNRDDKCRLFVWAYAQDDPEMHRSFLSTFGAAAWIEFLPADLLHKVSKTRQEIEKRFAELLPSLHIISNFVYARRGSTPFPLPLKNFKSEALDELKRLWYRGLSQEQLKVKVEELNTKFNLTHPRSAGGGFLDDRRVRFSPAKPDECHGKAHPNGASQKALLRGIFRFGVAVYPGFHYDVTNENASRNLKFTFIDYETGERNMTSERKKYVNISSNDIILPKR